MAGYVSTISPNEPVIGDDSHEFDEMLFGGELGRRGRLPRDFDAEPFGSLPFAEPFPSSLIIPESEWDDRIEEMERNKTRISDLAEAAGLGVLDQNGTNYCWINGPIHCCEIIRVIQGEPMIRLSPASCGAPIKNYRNVGGWGTEGLKYIVNTGAVPQEHWPANAINRKYDTAETRAMRDSFRCQEWWDLRPRNLNELMSCLLQRIPVAVGYNWWSHEVTASDPVALGNGKYGVRIRNSWGKSYGENGMSVLTGSKMLPDDAVAPRVMYAA